MKLFIGLSLILFGAFAGLYVGFWWGFIGGIVGAIEQIRAPHLDASILAFDLLKIIFANFIGWMVAIFCWIGGAALIQD